MALIDFLLARIADDEAATKYVSDDSGWELGQFMDSSDEFPPLLTISRGRVLAECEAKRRIVEHYRRAVEAVDSDKRRVMAGGYPHPQAAVLGNRDMSALEPVVHLLALPYADHPDYREEWRP